MERDLYERGYGLYKQGQYEEALNIFSAGLKESRQDPDLWYWVGYLQYETKHFYAALESFEQGARLMPSDSSFYRAIAMSYQSVGHVKFANEALQIAYELPSDSGVKEMILGQLALIKDDYHSAANHFQEALRLTPKAEQAHLYDRLGYTQLLLHQYSDARASYEKATNDFVAHPSYYYNLALAQRKTKDYHAAEASLRRAVEIDPNYHKAYSKLSALQFRKGKITDGLVSFYKAWKGACQEVSNRNEISDHRGMKL